MHIDLQSISSHLAQSQLTTAALLEELFQYDNLTLGQQLLPELEDNGRPLDPETAEAFWTNWGQAYRTSASRALATLTLEDRPDADIDGLFAIDPEQKHHFEVRYLSPHNWAARYNAPFGGSDGEWELYSSNSDLQTKYADLIAEFSQKA